MPISKQITLDATGATASYHVIGQVNEDYDGKSVVATLRSYVSSDTFAAGKQPVQVATSVYLTGIPASDQNTIAFAEAQLIAAQPTDGTATSPTLPFAANRYMFAGGTIVS
ncbi:hypothetical protein ACODYM_29330 [Burkholderia gladioli]|uniref:hypothetical protein n=1 Tax=Burkholderia gladioli TaxID=28095 RepID=UPI003B502C1E